MSAILIPLATELGVAGFKALEPKIVELLVRAADHILGNKTGSIKKPTVVSQIELSNQAQVDAGQADKSQLPSAAVIEEIVQAAWKRLDAARVLKGQETVVDPVVDPNPAGALPGHQTAVDPSASGSAPSHQDPIRRIAAIVLQEFLK